MITALRPIERVCQDAEPIAAMYREMGTQAAELVVNRALAELTLTMAGLTAQIRAHDVTDLARQLRRLQRMSEHLGMVSLGLVASDARQCVDSGDVTAFAAVWARLVRVAERSLSSDKDLLDQSV